MPKSANQKAKLLVLKGIFERYTDEDSGLTLQQIAQRLQENGISADRKTLYSDIEELRQFGMDIVTEPSGHATTYRLVSRDFELAELKLLVDAVQSSRFITDRKSRELIGKLESLASEHQAGQLQRQVIISGRVKTMNESIYYNIDKLHAAISGDRQISFQYVQWTVSKEMAPRKGGQKYTVSPWALVWGDDNYYLVAYESASDQIRHYRVDKMQRIELTEARRQGQERFQAFDVAKYTRRLFGMFGGETVRVSFEARNSMAGILIDRFGKDIWMVPIDGERFSASADVTISPSFFGWIMGLGDGIRITAPESVVSQMRDEIRRMNALYRADQSDV